MYRELRRLLIAVGGQGGVATQRDYACESKCDVDALFGQRLRTAVLLALDVADTGLDASALHRIFPEHGLQGLRGCLERFVDIGVLGTRRWKNTIVYDFDQTHEWYRALRGLLSPINNRWPAYAAAAVDVLAELEPLGRQRMRARARS